MARWISSLSTIQDFHDEQEKAFWSHLSQIYKRNTLPFPKIVVGTGIISDEQNITEELFRYFSDLAKVSEIDPSNPHDIQVEMEYRAPNEPGWL